jgi:hypothetical protein
LRDEYDIRSPKNWSTTKFYVRTTSCNTAHDDQPLEEWLVAHPGATIHPVIAAYLARGGTPAHQARMAAIFAHGVPDASLCTSAEDVNR